MFTFCYARLVAAIVLMFTLIPVDNTFKPSIDTVDIYTGHVSVGSIDAACQSGKMAPLLT